MGYTKSELEDAMLSDAGDPITRSPTDAEIRKLLKEGDIERLEAEGLLIFNSKMRAQERKQNPDGRPPPPLPTRKPNIPKKAHGGMTPKRNGNTDYRKGGMVYSTTVKRG